MDDIQPLLKRSEYLKAEDLFSKYIFCLIADTESEDPIISFDELIALFECLKFAPKKAKPPRKYSVTETYLGFRAQTEGRPFKENDGRSRIAIDFECSTGKCKKTLELPIKFYDCDCFKYVTKTLDPDSHLTIIEPFLTETHPAIEKFSYQTVGVLIKIMFSEVWKQESYACEKLSSLIFGLIVAVNDLTDIIWYYIDDLSEAALNEIVASDTAEVRVPPLNQVDIEKLHSHREFAPSLIERYAANKHKLYGYPLIFENPNGKDEKQKSFVAQVKRMMSPKGKTSTPRGKKGARKADTSTSKGKPSPSADQPSTSKEKLGTPKRKPSLSSQATGTSKGKFSAIKRRLSLLKDEASSSK